MTTKHTALPWYSEKKDFTWVVGNKEKIGYSDRIAELPQWGDKAGFGGRAEVAENAAFIVLACNSHYKTEAAIDKFLESIGHVSGIEKERKAFIDELAAIAKARCSDESVTAVVEGE